MYPTDTAFIRASWQLLDDLVLSISAPEYVIEVLKNRIDLKIEDEESSIYQLRIRWNPNILDSLKNHFWKDSLGSNSLLEYRDSQKHLFLGISHYELLHVDEGVLEFYAEGGIDELHNQYSYPFLRWIGRLLNRRGFAPIHAAAIGGNGLFVLVPGKATAGKSTTTATWMIHERDYLSDDFVFLSDKTAHGYYRGINLRYSSLSLFTSTAKDLFLGINISPVSDEKVFLHDNANKNLHKSQGHPTAIWCPEIGHTKPHLRKISSSSAYNSLLSSIELNKDYHFDLRLCNQVIKKIVSELPAYALCLCSDVIENYSFMHEAFQRINQDQLPT
jgi:hypothetical protein